MELLPKSCTLPDSFLDISLPSVSGCRYEGTLGGLKVHIKHVRMSPEGDSQKAKKARSRYHISSFSDAKKTHRHFTRWP